MFQFSDNLIQLQKLTADWSRKRATENQIELKEVEEALQVLFDQNDSRIFLEEEFLKMKKFEG